MPTSSMCASACNSGQSACLRGVVHTFGRGVILHFRSTDRNTNSNIENDDSDSSHPVFFGMGSKTNRKTKVVKTVEVKVVEVKEEEEEEPTGESLAPSKLNKADRKRYKKANKKRKAAALPPQHLIRAQEPESVFQERLAPQLISRLHPDFDQPTSPQDVLFETDDEVLFYFSGRHLARVSPFFRDMLALSLSGSKIRDGLHGKHSTLTSLAIPLHFTTSFGLALLFHVLLFEFSPYPVLPNRVLGNGFLAALVNAHECAGRFDIPSFASIVRPFIIPCAKSLKLTKPFEAYALALMAQATNLANEICWLTLAFPLESMPVEVSKILEQKHPHSLESLRDLHYRIQPAVGILRYQLEFTPVPGLPEGRGFDLPDCRRFACAITTGYDLDRDEVSTTRRLATERVMEGLFVDEEVRPGIHTIVSKLNTCFVCNVGLSILLKSLVLEFEDKYKP